MIKVFGIGLNKTGTKTLGVCLRQLGFRHLSCCRDLLVALRAGRLDEIFAEIDKRDSFEDWPYPLMYEELYYRYGDRARFILTTRLSPERWLGSLKAHSLKTDPYRHCRRLAYNYDYPHGHEQEHMRIYEQHNAAVRAFFAKHDATHQLLCVCWEKGDGWKELCSFLNLSQPNMAFPHVNQAKQAAIPDTSFTKENRLLIAKQLSELRSLELGNTSME